MELPDLPVGRLKRLKQLVSAFTRGTCMTEVSFTFRIMAWGFVRWGFAHWGFVKASYFDCIHRKNRFQMSVTRSAALQSLQVYKVFVATKAVNV